MSDSLNHDSNLPTEQRTMIAVTGRNLNVGYWNQPDMTEAKFLADPTGCDERTYLTGDSVGCCRMVF